MIVIHCCYCLLNLCSCRCHKTINFGCVSINHNWTSSQLILTILFSLSISESGKDRRKVIASSGGCDIISTSSSPDAKWIKPEKIVQFVCEKSFVKKVKKEEKNNTSVCAVTDLCVVDHLMTLVVICEKSYNLVLSAAKKAFSEKWKDQWTDLKAICMWIRRWSSWKLSDSISCEKEKK